MNVVVFSNDSRTRDGFSAIERSRKHAISFNPLQDLGSWLKNGREPALVYVDLHGLSRSDRGRLLRQLSRCDDVAYCIVDPKNEIPDPASLLRDGAIDYVNRALVSEGISTRRIDEVAEFVSKNYPGRLTDTTRSSFEASMLLADGRELILSGDDWSNVHPSHEYTFCMLFAELDHIVEYTNHTSERYAASVAASFRRLMEETMKPHQGRLWMWRDFGGLMLFPFNGQSCAAILPCIRMLLHRVLDNVERFDLKTGLSYRLALHIGNTVYRRRGETGHIVSDSVNFVHHLGQKFTLPGNFTLTGQVYELIPESLRSLFLLIGEYEGRLVYRMRPPLRPT